MTAGRAPASQASESAALAREKSQLLAAIAGLDNKFEAGEILCWISIESRFAAIAVEVVGLAVVPGLGRRLLLRPSHLAQGLFQRQVYGESLDIALKRPQVVGLWRIVHLLLVNYKLRGRTWQLKRLLDEIIWW